MKYLRPSAEFRDIWQYTNTMYMLLSSLPPLLLPSKTPFSQYVTQNIFNPLGMDSTTYSLEKASLSGLMADGLTREGVNVSGNPLGDGKVRIIPFWPKIAEEDDGHGQLSSASHTNECPF
jgi:CubicO group peptidase (beta-lactamase class C family)